jgi:hypothetical protein
MQGRCEPRGKGQAKSRRLSEKIVPRLIVRAWPRDGRPICGVGPRTHPASGRRLGRHVKIERKELKSGLEVHLRHQHVRVV